MDERALQLARELVTPRYIAAGEEGLRGVARELRSLLAQRRCPDDGLPPAAMEQIVAQLANMDSNNFAAHIGAGEREGRVAAPLVQRRHFYLSHGIGRSGDVTSDQPKAAGSSLLAHLANVMALDVIKCAGARTMRAAVVVPMATGMSLALVLRALAKQREEEDEKAHRDEAAHTTNTNDEEEEEEEVRRRRRMRYAAPRVVIWPRVDQKTALKCIDAAGLVAWPVELRPARMQRRTPCESNACAEQRKRAKECPQAVSPSHPPLSDAPSSSPAYSVPSAHTEEDRHPYYLQVEPSDVAAAIDAAGGRDGVLCVLSTTSCFAPRLPDDTLALATLCAARDIPYVVNNAYGLQSRSIMTRLEAAQRAGRVDYVVQSTDKNFLVPVGGSVIASGEARLVQRVAALYAGRASVTPSLDLFLTCLTLGRRGFDQLWQTRYVCLQRLLSALDGFAQARQEQLVTETMHCADCLAALKPRTRLTTNTDTMNGGDETNEEKKKEKNRRGHWPRNDISVAVTMAHYGSPAEAQALGAKLFRSGVTGPRVIVPAESTVTTIAGCRFCSYGTHQNAPPCAMLVLACGVGMTEEEVSEVMRRLERLWPVQK